MPLGTNFQPDYIDNPHAHYQNFTQADLTNARSALRYEPRFPLEEGVRDYMQWLYLGRARVSRFRTRWIGFSEDDGKYCRKLIMRGRLQSMKFGGKAASICQRVEDNAFHPIAQRALPGCSQIAKRSFRQLKFVPIAVDFCTETFVKLDAAVIPFRNPPLNHPAASLHSFFRDGLH